MEGVREENRAKGRKREQMGEKEKKSKKKKERKENKTLSSSKSGRAVMGSSGIAEMNILIWVSSPTQQVMMAKEVGYVRTCQSY